MAKRKGFTLVEILIVVAILGILAAVVIPEFQGHRVQAQESTAKEMLQSLRGRMELYTAQHNEIPPGYINGDMTDKPDRDVFFAQLTFPSNINGLWAAPGTAGYDYGPYMNAMPKNPFNGSHEVWIMSNNPKVIANSQVSSNFGWQYHGPSRTMRLNTFGTDSTGMDYQDY